MKNLTKLVFASALALSTAGTAFAYENDLESVPSVSSMNSGEHQATGKRAAQHRASDSRAYAPAPARLPAAGGVDFGIGSQS